MDVADDSQAEADARPSAALGRWAITHRRALLCALAAASGLTTSVRPADLVPFAAAGAHILSGQFGHVYNVAGIQAGPLQLLASRLLVALSHHNQPAPVLLALGNAVIVALVMVATGRAGRRTDPATATRRELAVGALTVLWLAPNGLWTGHPAELAIPLLWIAAVGWVRRDRVAPAALALGVAAGIAPWAVLAFPSVLAARRVRAGLGAAAGASALTLGWYLPFVLSGHFRLFSFRWAVARGSLVHLLDPHLSTADWAVRLGQAVVVGAGCAYVAWRARGHPAVAALAPLTAALMRVGTDPVQLGYYWVPAGVCAIAAVALAPTGLVRRDPIVAILLAYLVWAAYASGLTLVGCAAGVALVAVMARPGGGPSEAHAVGSASAVAGVP
jgi:hypothetical protein